MRKVVSIYVDPEAYSEMKRLCHNTGVSVSSRIDDLIKEWVQQATGKKFAENPIEYEGLKREHFKIVKDLDSIQNRLLRLKVYESLKQTAVKVGLNREYTNVREVSGRFLQEWAGLKEHAHLFITLLELVQRKHEVERQLDGVRTRSSLKQKEELDMPTLF